jgi:hypothetical protein
VTKKFGVSLRFSCAAGIDRFATFITSAITFHGRDAENTRCPFDGNTVVQSQA